MTRSTWFRPLLFGSFVVAAPSCATGQATPSDWLDLVEAQGYVGGYTSAFVLDACPAGSPEASALVGEAATRNLVPTVRGELAVIWEPQLQSCADAVLDAWFVESFPLVATSGTGAGWGFVGAVPRVLTGVAADDFWASIRNAGIREDLRSTLAIEYSGFQSDGAREQALVAQLPLGGAPPDWAGHEITHLAGAIGDAFVADLAALLPSLDTPTAAAVASAVHDQIEAGVVSVDDPGVVAMSSAVSAYGGLELFAGLLGGETPQVPSVSAVADTYITQGSANGNHGDEDVLIIRQSGRHRALIQVSDTDLVSFTGTVVSVHLEFDIVSNGNNWSPTGRTVDVHRMLAPWTQEGATWNCSDDTNTSNNRRDCDSAGEWDMRMLTPPPYDASPSGTLLVTNAMLGPHSFDVTADVQAMISGQVPNHGWIIRKTDEGEGGRIELASIESGSGPRLVIVVGG